VVNVVSVQAVVECDGCACLIRFRLDPAATVPPGATIHDMVGQLARAGADLASGDLWLVPKDGNEGNDSLENTLVVCKDCMDEYVEEGELKALEPPEENDEQEEDHPDRI